MGYGYARRRLRHELSRQSDSGQRGTSGLAHLDAATQVKKRSHASANNIAPADLCHACDNKTHGVQKHQRMLAPTRELLSRRLSFAKISNYRRRYLNSSSEEAKAVSQAPLDCGLPQCVFQSVGWHGEHVRKPTVTKFIVFGQRI